MQDNNDTTSKNIENMQENNLVSVALFGALGT